ncbi:hypothetical protein BC831DRAFT_457271 [Entophlyctis helioformis]|nr:hypothetical protein BC831DRAFT_457271 [Entophlyctis helioformis]
MLRSLASLSLSLSPRPSLRLSLSLSPRSLSSSASAASLFVVVAHDHTDPAALDRRLQVRADHIARAGSEAQAGVLLLGGAILSDGSTTSDVVSSSAPIAAPFAATTPTPTPAHDTQPKKMVGSILLLDLPSLPAVHDWLKSDVYVRNNVWQYPAATQIYPFVAARLHIAPTGETTQTNLAAKPPATL